jgi:hypothetical protein
VNDVNPLIRPQRTFLIGGGNPPIPKISPQQTPIKATPLKCMIISSPGPVQRNTLCSPESRITTGVGKTSEESSITQGVTNITAYLNQLASSILNCSKPNNLKKNT